MKTAFPWMNPYSMTSWVGTGHSDPQANADTMTPSKVCSIWFPIGLELPVQNKQMQYMEITAPWLVGCESYSALLLWLFGFLWHTRIQSESKSLAVPDSRAANMKCPLFHLRGKKRGNTAQVGHTQYKAKRTRKILKWKEELFQTEMNIKIWRND